MRSIDQAQRPGTRDATIANRDAMPGSLQHMVRRHASTLKLYDSMTDCECKSWCSDGRPPLTEHHRNCRKRNLEAESVALVSALIKGIECWAADEDGVHPDAWNAYCRAIVFVGDLAKLKVVLEKSERVVPPNDKLTDAATPR